MSAHHVQVDVVTHTRPAFVYGHCTCGWSAEATFRALSIPSETEAKDKIAGRVVDHLERTP